MNLSRTLPQATLLGSCLWIALLLCTASIAEAAPDFVQKCNAVREVNENRFAKCLGVANLNEIRGWSSDRQDCLDRYNRGVAKARKRFVDGRPAVGEFACRLNSSAAEQAEAMIIIGAGWNPWAASVLTPRLSLIESVEPIAFILSSAVYKAETEAKEEVCSGQHVSYDAETTVCESWTCPDLHCPNLDCTPCPPAPTYQHLSHYPGCITLEHCKAIPTAYPGAPGDYGMPPGYYCQMGRSRYQVLPICGQAPSWNNCPVPWENC